MGSVDSRADNGAVAEEPIGPRKGLEGLVSNIDHWFDAGKKKDVAQLTPGEGKYW